MKKLFAVLMAVVMLFTAACALAESFEAIEKSNVLNQFLKETDTEKKDIALQVQFGDQVADLVIRVDGSNLHLVARNNGTEAAHLQVNPTGLYMGSDGKATLLRTATVTTVLEDTAKEIADMIQKAIDSIPKDQLPTEEQLKAAAQKEAVLSSLAVAQAQADAVTLSSAAAAFAGKFKPEYILDVKEEAGSVEVTLRADAYAAALAEAMDELMSNPGLAELVNRQAATSGGTTFSTLQKEWLLNRQATLEAIRTMQSTEKLEENGHWTSHFQIGEETEEQKALVYDTDAWLAPDHGAAEITVCLGLKDEDPLLKYEFAVSPDAYREKLSAGDDSSTEVLVDMEDNRISRGKVITVIDGNEELRMDVGPDYMYLKGPKAGISTSVRETLTGKIRYELVAETAEGNEASLITDFYEDGDSLICELKTSESDQSLKYMISRIDKIAIEDLSASENLNEITNEEFKAELDSVLKLMFPAGTTEAPEAPEAPEAAEAPEAPAAPEAAETPEATEAPEAGK